MSVSQRELELSFMRAAIEQAKRCENVDGAYNVGAVIVRNSDKTIISTGYSRELEGNTHAEECAILKLFMPTSTNQFGTGPEITKMLGEDCSIYTTMEPCSTRLSGKSGCVYRILQAGIKTLYYSAAEPPNFVECHGLQIACNGGVKVIHIQELEEECKLLNSHLSLTQVQ